MSVRLVSSTARAAASDRRSATRLKYALANRRWMSVVAGSSRAASSLDGQPQLTVGEVSLPRPVQLVPFSPATATPPNVLATEPAPISDCSVVAVGRAQRLSDVQGDPALLLSELEIAVRG